MLKVRSKLEFTVNNKLFQFECDPDSALQDAKEALFQCLAFLAKVEEQAKSQQAAQQAQAAPEPVQEASDKVETLPTDENLR